MFTKFCGNLSHTRQRGVAAVRAYITQLEKRIKAKRVVNRSRYVRGRHVEIHQGFTGRERAPRAALSECAKASYLDEDELEFKPTREALVARAALAFITE